MRSRSTSLCGERVSGSMRSQGGMSRTSPLPAKKAASCASERASSGQRVQGGQEEGLRGALQARDLRLLAAPNAVERVPEAGIGLEERMKFRVHVTKIQYEIPLLPPLKRDRAAMSLRRSEATEAISDILEKVEIAALPSVARNDESRS